MNRRIATIAILTLTACPQDDAPPTDAADEIEASSADAPDLPTDDSTESDSSTATGDDASEESTEDSEGSTSEESTGEDDVDSSTDTDGETGSEAVPTSLIVESAGLRIGYLIFAQEYGFLVWDDINEVTFSINQQTGHVVGGAGGGSGYHSTPDCTGTPYINTNVPVGICNQVPAPVRRGVTAEAPFSGGHVAPTSLHIGSGEPVLVNIQSIDTGVDCIAYATQFCAYVYVETNVIPKTFPLPITVVEATLAP